MALAWVGKSPARFHSFPEKGLSRVGEYDVHRYLLRDTHLSPCSGRWLFCVVPFCRLALLPAARCLRIFQKRKSEKSRHVVCYIKETCHRIKTYKTLATRGVRLFVVNIFHVWVRMFGYACLGTPSLTQNPRAPHVILAEKKNNEAAT